jgi:hypothetical protein
VHKLLRCLKLVTYVSELDDLFATQFVVVKLLKVLVSTVFLSHYIACARFMFGHDMTHTNHWLPRPHYHPPTTAHAYVEALYWSFGVMTGLFEGELPRSTTEFVFTITVALCGFTLFVSLCATFFMISKCESGQSEYADAKINQLRHVLSFHGVPEFLQLQAIEYLRVSWFCGWGSTTNKMIIQFYMPLSALLHGRCIE